MSIVRIIDKVSEQVGRFSSLLVLALIGLVVLEVILRYFFHSPTAWGSELSGYVFGTFWVLAGAWTLSKKGMVNMDVIYMRFSKKNKALIDCIIFIFALIFCVALFWFSTTSAIDSFHWKETSGTQWSPPFYPVKIILAVGAFLLLAQAISNLVRDIYTLKGNNK